MMDGLDEDDAANPSQGTQELSTELRNMFVELRAHGVQVERTNRGTIRFAIEKGGIIEFEQVEGAGTFEPVDIGGVHFESTAEGAVKFTSISQQPLNFESVDDHGVVFKKTAEGGLQFGPTVVGATHFEPTLKRLPSNFDSADELMHRTQINENPIAPPRGAGPE